MKTPNQRDLINLKCENCKEAFMGNLSRKICDTCRIEKSRASSRRYNKNSPNNSTRKIMIRNREFVRNYKKDKKCEICSYNKYPEILDFHHEDRKTKTATVCTLMKTLKRIDIIKKEIDKCTLICPNCHRELHIKEGLWKTNGR
jgi:hypothetical protein